jgi:hypothetical protein
MLTATSRSALAALPTTDVAWLSEDGRQGVFQWNPSNLSGWVAVDTSKALYIAPDSDTTGASGAWVRVNEGRLDAKWCGAKGDSVSDDAAAWRCAFKLWEYSARANGQFGLLRLTAPAGRYMIGSTVDLRTIFAGQSYYAMTLDLDPNATFKAAISLVDNPLVYFGPASGGAFSLSSLRFGGFDGNAKRGTGITLAGVVDSDITISSVGGFKDNAGNGLGIKFDVGTNAPIYNCRITVGSLLSNAYGMIGSDSNSPPHGFQGNIVDFGHVSGNGIGVWMMNQSTSNTFNFACLEANGTGILDQAGYNEYYINFSNDVINLGTAHPVTIEGYGFTVNNVGRAKGFVRNDAVPLTPAIPPLPASGGYFVNNYMRPASMSVVGGSVTSLTIEGVPVPTNGIFAVPFGSAVQIFYTSPPQWAWTFH